MSRSARPLRRLYDMHCHCHEFTFNELDEIFSSNPDLVVVGVSEDVESLYTTWEFAQSFPQLIPCSGLHPWIIRDKGIHEAEELARLTYRLDIPCIGEVGLDKKFVNPEWWMGQLWVFRLFARLAHEIDGYVTVHSPSAWREALEILVDENVRKAMFHWYTGPLSLIDTIVSSGYYISINPAIKIQSKHVKVALYTPVEHLVFESDGPYNYRGLRLSPLMIPETIERVAELKKLSSEKLFERARRNSEWLLYG